MIVVGVGLQEGATTEALRDAVAGLDLPEVDVVATVDARASHPAVVALAVGRTLRCYPSEALAEVGVPAPSGRVERLAGTASVAEAAALLAAREHDPAARLVVGKTVGVGVTVAAASCDGS